MTQLAHNRPLYAMSDQGVLGSAMNFEDDLPTDYAQYQPLPNLAGELFFEESGAPSPTNRIQQSFSSFAAPRPPKSTSRAPPPPQAQGIDAAELRLGNESEIERLISGTQVMKSETTSTRSGRAVRNRNACIERVIDPEQEEDEVDLEVALSYGSRQGIALDKPNKRRRRGDDPLAAESHRLEKNRQSARECRLRKKAYIRGLETQSRRLSDKVKQQDEEIASLRANLKAVYDKYQALAAKALSA
eukprot:m.217503 g.217503  ORF g.217503 m.217503 type:complete len:245 (+) comp10787_c0_seq3:450-1184(+)